MAEFLTKAILLRSTPLKESDLLVTVYTQQMGLVRAVAKGALRSKKRFMNCFDEFGLIRAGLVQKSEAAMARVDHASLLFRPEFDHRLGRLGLAGLVTELTLLFCPERVPEPTIFTALNATLKGIATTQDPMGLALGYALRLSHEAGFGPNLDSCMVCETGLEETKGGCFQPDHGTLTCRQCGSGQQVHSLGCLKSMRLCQTVEPSSLGRIRFPQRELVPAFRMVTDYLRHIVGREIRSIRFLEKVGLG